MQTNDDTPVDRQQLYEEVWAEPVSIVAKRYGLSDVGLAKICRKLAIPLPTVGYWSKIKAGKIMKKAPLPSFTKQSKSKERRLLTLGTSMQSPPPLITKLKRISIDEQKAIADKKQKASLAKKTAQSIVISNELIDPHPLVHATMKRLRRHDGWKNEKGLRSAPDEVLDIEVTELSIDRALFLMDNLIKKMTALSVTVRVIPALRKTELDVDGTSVSVKISEYVRRKNHEETPAEKKARERYWNRSRYDSSISYPSIPQYDYIPTGKLTIHAGLWPSRNWNDTNSTSLEDRLDEVVADIFVLAAAIKEKEDEEKRRKEEARLAEDRYQFLKNRLETEQKMFNELDKDAINWECANRIRSFVAALEQKTVHNGNLSPELSDWLEWARAKADWLDPLIFVSDLILDAPELQKPRSMCY